MKVRFGRSIILRLFTGCKSESGVAMASPNRLESLPSNANCKKERVRTSFRLFRLRKLNIGHSIHRLFRSLRNVSLIFAHRGEEEEAEMEIGFPTDVKHLTHIGWDGSMTTISNDGGKGEFMGSRDDMNASEIVSLPSISLKQLEMAMAGQAQQPVFDPSIVSCSTGTLTS